MFRIGVTRHISAAHHLRGYKGKCEDLHGHNWKITAEVGSEKLDSLGMVMDFGDLKKTMDGILGDLDHTLLNDHPHFTEKNPSSEELARYVFKRLEDSLNGSLSLFSVKIWESHGSYAIYTRD